MNNPAFMAGRLLCRLVCATRAHGWPVAGRVCGPRHQAAAPHATRLRHVLVGYRAAPEAGPRAHSHPVAAADRCRVVPRVEIEPRAGDAREGFHRNGLVFPKDWGDGRKHQTLGEPPQVNNLGQREFAKLIAAAEVRRGDAGDEGAGTRQDQPAPRSSCHVPPWRSTARVPQQPIGRIRKDYVG
jgi:hypothetical protein